ncbi:MAG: hypothetical protein QXO70_02655 [Candidatus Pacearchaeota archaeon]
MKASIVWIEFIKTWFRVNLFIEFGMSEKTLLSYFSLSFSNYEKTSHWYPKF